MGVGIMCYANSIIDMLLLYGVFVIDRNTTVEVCFLMTNIIGVGCCNGY